MGKKLDKKFYEKEMARLQTELVYVQRWVRETGARIVVLFEGRDAAGKGGAIKRITELLNPRICRVVALPVPTEKEKTQWYFQRYVEHLPAAGEMVLFDRSWYNRAGVEKVMGFCTDEQYEYFMRVCPDFENMLIRDGIILIKYWFSVSEEEQRRRFEARINDPNKQWKISPMDMQSRQHWVDYSRAKDTMLRYTDTKLSPWYIVDAEDKKKSRLNCIAHLLSVIPYKRIEFPKLELQPLQEDNTYIRPPMEEQTWVPDIATKRNAEYLAEQEKAEKAEKAKALESEDRAEEKKKKSDKEKLKDNSRKGFQRVYEKQSFSNGDNRYLQRARHEEEKEDLHQSRRIYYENYVEEEENESRSKQKARIRYADLLARQRVGKARLLEQEESLEDLEDSAPEVYVDAVEEMYLDESELEDLAELEALEGSLDMLEDDQTPLASQTEAQRLAEEEAFRRAEEEAKKKSRFEAERLALLSHKEAEQALVYETEPELNQTKAEEMDELASLEAIDGMENSVSSIESAGTEPVQNLDELEDLRQRLAVLAEQERKQQAELARLTDLERVYADKVKALEEELRHREARLAHPNVMFSDLDEDMEDLSPDYYAKRISKALQESRAGHSTGEDEEAQEIKRKKKKRRRIYDGLDEERIFWKNSQR